MVRVGAAALAKALAKEAKTAEKAAKAKAVNGVDEGVVDGGDRDD